MKFLQLGLGSMGKRRVRCLQALRAGEIVAFDVGRTAAPRRRRCTGSGLSGPFEEGMAGGIPTP